MNKLKSIFILGAIIVAVLLIGRLRVSDAQNINGYIIDNYLHHPIRKIDLSRTQDLDVPKFKLLIDSNDIRSISQEYDQKTAANDWLKHQGKLVYNKDTFDVVVTGHANTPAGDKRGDRFSLRIKLKNGKKINGVKKFSFILFDSIINRTKASTLFCDALDVNMKPSNLVKLLINSNLVWWPMYFEPSNKKFFKKNKFLYRKIDLFKSPVQCFQNSQLFIDSIYRGDSNKIHLGFRKYLNSKKYFFNKNELQSLSKHLAVQLVLDLNGHGLTGENFVFVIDKPSQNFHPFITRSDVPGVCDLTAKNLKDHYTYQLRKFINEHGNEILFTPLLKNQNFVDSVRSNIKYILSKRDYIMHEFIEYNKKSEYLQSGEILDVHFNWRDECEMDERIYLPHVSRCMLNHNLDFWSEKISEVDFWDSLKF